MSNYVNTSSIDSTSIEFPWHNSAWQQFTKSKSHNQLPHAILLSGEEGIGKLSLAKRMAKSLICIENSQNLFDSCNQCQSCKTYESGANPDFTEITLLEDKQQIGVDQIRALSEFLNYSRSYNTNRVVILHPVERMNVNAANSLLKSLEEPSAHTVLILVTAKFNQLLPTIKSRCQLLTVSSPNAEVAVEWLTNFQKNNPDDSNKIDSNLLIELAGNKPLNAIKLTQEDIDNRSQFFNDLNSVIKEQTTITEMAKKWEKHDFEAILDWQINVVKNNIQTAVCKSDHFDESNVTTDSPKYIALTQHLSSEEHWHLYQGLIKQKQYIHTSVNSLMFLENMVMLWMKTR